MEGFKPIINIFGIMKEERIVFAMFVDFHKYTWCIYSSLSGAVV